MLNERVVSGGVCVRRCCAAECVGWPIQFELLEPRMMWSADAESNFLNRASLTVAAAIEDDPGFADDGWAVVDAGDVDSAHAIVVQADGKMVVAGWSGPKTQPGSGILPPATSTTLVRLNRDGTVDPTFGQDGFARFDVSIPRAHEDAIALALQADGKLLVGGDGLRRFTADGALDDTFGNGGVAVAGGIVESIGVTGEGKVVVADRDFLFRRFNVDGSVDTSFGQSGSASMRPNDPEGNKQLRKLIVQPDGKVLGIGTLFGPNFNFKYMLARLSADGTPDASFGDGGFVFTFGHEGGAYLQAHSAALDARGRILVGGYGHDGMTLARYHADGSLDQSFGDRGIVTTQEGAHAYDIVVDDDGTIVVTGGYAGPAVFYFNDDGTFERRLETRILARSTLEGGATALAMGPDGELLVTAQIEIFNTAFEIDRTEKLSDFYVLRVPPGAGAVSQPNVQDPVPPPPPEPPGPEPESPQPGEPTGELDDTFGGTGIVTTDATGGVERAQKVLVQPDGKTIVVGYSGTYTGPGADSYQNTETHIALVRYNVNGTLDTSFGDDGVVIVPARNIVGMRYDVADLPAALQADGKILVGGMALYRFNADGSVDTAFGDNGAAATNLLLVDALAVLPNGKIVISTRYGFEFACYNSDGSLDTSFGGAARSTHVNPPYPLTPGNVNHEPGRDIVGWSEIGELIAQPDGKIIAVGTVRTLPHDTLTLRYYVMRMNADGSLDGTFGDGGIVLTKVPGAPQAEAWGAALQPDGKIVVAGASGSGRGTIARYNADGSVDTSFGIDGFIVTTREGAGADVAIQANGKIVITTAAGAVRYNADGTFDRAFIAPGSPGGISVAIAPDGGIVIVGQPSELAVGGESDFFVARFGGEGVSEIDPPDNSGGSPEQPGQLPDDGPDTPQLPARGIRGGAANDVLFGDGDRARLEDRNRSLFADGLGDEEDEDEEEDEDALPRIL